MYINQALCSLREAAINLSYRRTYKSTVYPAVSLLVVSTPPSQARFLTGKRSQEGERRQEENRRKRDDGEEKRRQEGGRGQGGRGQVGEF